MQTCIIPGCEKEAKNSFGVRLRRPDTTAIWAPITQTYLCSDHSTLGMRITIYLEPNYSQEIETIVIGVSQPPVKRVTPISKRPSSSD